MTRLRSAGQSEKPLSMTLGILRLLLDGPMRPNQLKRGLTA